MLWQWESKPFHKKYYNYLFTMVGLQSWGIPCLLGWDIPFGYPNRDWIHILSSSLPCGVAKVLSKIFISVWYFSYYLVIYTCIEDWVLLTHTSLNRISQHCQSGLLLLCVFCQYSIHWSRTLLIAIQHNLTSRPQLSFGLLANVMILLLISCILCKNKEGHGLNNWGWIQVIVGD